MIALALAVTLAWTVPTRTADACRCGLYVPREARVYRHGQSATWRAMRPAMEALGFVRGGKPFARSLGNGRRAN